MRHSISSYFALSKFRDSNFSGISSSPKSDFRRGQRKQLYWFLCKERVVRYYDRFTACLINKLTSIRDRKLSKSLDTDFADNTDSFRILRTFPSFPCPPCPKKVYPKLRLSKLFEWLCKPKSKLQVYIRMLDMRAALCNSRNKNHWRYSCR